MSDTPTYEYNTLVSGTLALTLGVASLMELLNESDIPEAGSGGCTESEIVEGFVGGV